MIRSYFEFISESSGDPKVDFAERLAQQLLTKVKSSRSSRSSEYLEFSGMKFSEPFAFDLNLYVRSGWPKDVRTDLHFENLPWEELNLESKGYAVDAITAVKDGRSTIEIYLIVDPEKEPHSYRDLYARLADIISHETNHIDQVTDGPGGFNADPTHPKVRDEAKGSFKYFLLGDEIESMVEGMKTRSEIKRIPIDHVFQDYLSPFVRSKYITHDEYLEVMERWIRHAADRYPDAQFSESAQKIVGSR